MLKHYVEFSYPGLIFNEKEVKEIARRDTKLVTVPEGAFAYRFFDRNEVVEDGETLFGRDKNYSPYIYFGKEYTLKEIKEQFPEQTTLIHNIECNGYNRVVKTRRGNWQILGEGDTVIES